MPSSLYVHIPFCLKRCIYCDFVSGIYNPQTASSYITALRKEIAGIPDREPLSTLYIGGGTPTALPTDLLVSLIGDIADRFQFSKDCESTIEANPGTIDPAKLSAMRSAGINRISIGVQSFNDDELVFLGRIHSAGDAVRAVGDARRAGFENIGIDLIYGIPGQTMTAWEHSLAQAVSLNPAHISAYELSAERGTLLHSLLQDTESGMNPRVQLPAEDIIIAMYEYAIDHLSASGYGHYEISNYSIPGYECRHNLNYWDRGEYYGAGPGAHSFLSGKRIRNKASAEEYISVLSEGGSPVEYSEQISSQLALSEALFLGLRKTAGVSAEAIEQRYGTNVLACFQKEIDLLKGAGLISVVAGMHHTMLQLTRRGLLLSNEVFEKFL